MTIVKRTYKDGSETITVQIEDTVEVLTMTQWSKLIATVITIEVKE